MSHWDPSDRSAPLADAGELARRPSRDPDYAAEARALGLLAQDMADNPGGVLRRCAELAMELCRADSAGISILEPGGPSGIFRWHVAVGGFAANLHGTMPREASPCGMVMDRDSVLLFNDVERLFPALRGVEPRIHESLLAPWHVGGKVVGTLWVIMHTPEGRFDAEDARLLQSLTRFAAAGFQRMSDIDEANAGRIERERAEAALRETENHTRLLLAELQHRVRNTLSVVRAIVRRTAGTSETVEDYAMHLDGRLDAVGRVQAAVTRNPAAGLDLGSLVADTLLAHGAREGERVRAIAGPAIRLRPRAAEILALAIHELATNAVKYGALAAENGRIAVDWNVETIRREARLVLHWVETGVNGTGEPPTRRGFGSELIERTLAYELGGEASLRFEPEGLRCTILVPLDEILVQSRDSH